MLTYDIKQAFRARWFLISAGMMLVIVCVAGMDVLAEVVRKGDLLEDGWTVKFVADMFTGNTMGFVLPVLCTLPYASAFTDEYKSGEIWLALGRICRKKYIYSKAVTAALAGGSMLFAGCLLVFAVFTVVFSSVERPQTVSETQAVLSGSFLTVMKISFRYFAFGALGASVGLSASTLMNNRYMAWLAPFIAQYLLIILCERYFSRNMIFYPREWLDPSEVWPLDTWSAVIWMLFLTLFVLWFFVRGAERRIGSGGKS